MLVEVTAGAAGTVMVAVLDLLVSATEVAVIVTVCEELVAAGAVNVAEVVVSLDKVPALALQVTPAEFLSWLTVAVRVVVSVPSTVLAAAVTATLGELEPPVQPVMKPSVVAVKTNMTKAKRDVSIRKPRVSRRMRMPPENCDRALSLGRDSPTPPQSDC